MPRFIRFPSTRSLVAVAALAAVVGAGAAANAPLTWYAEHRAGAAVHGCARLSGVHVGLESFALPRIATGHLTGTQVRIGRASIDGMTISDIRAYLPDVAVTPGLLFGSSRISLRSAVVRAAITAADLAAYLRTKGIAATVAFDGTGRLVHITPALLRIDIPMAVTLQDGGIRLEPEPGSLLQSALHLGWIIDIPGVDVTTITEEGDRLLFRAVLTGNPATPACALNRLLANPALPGLS